MKSVIVWIFIVYVKSVQSWIIPRSYHTVAKASPGFTSQKASPIDFSLSLTLLSSDMIPPDTVFNDSIVTFDDSIRNMLVAFTVFVAVVTGIKLLTGQMDQAIEQILIEFESTMRRFYPQRWEVLSKSLEGLEGDARDVKLLSLMEELQIADPDFMARVKEKMSQNNPMKSS